MCHWKQTQTKTHTHTYLQIEVRYPYQVLLLSSNYQANLPLAPHQAGCVFYHVARMNVHLTYLKRGHLSSLVKHRNSRKFRFLAQIMTHNCNFMELLINRPHTLTGMDRHCSYTHSPGGRPTTDGSTGDFQLVVEFEEKWRSNGRALRPTSEVREDMQEWFQND